MSSVKFVIPLRLEDLKNAGHSSINRYVVQQTYTPSEINDFISDVCDQINLSGPDVMCDEFDKFYCALINFSHIDDDKCTTLWRAIIRSSTQLESNLSSELCNQRSNIFTDPIEKQKECNLLKMHIFTLCTFIDVNEDRMVKKSTGNERTVGGNKVVKKKNSFLEKWEKDKLKGMEIMQKIFVLPLQFLFDPPIIEETMITCATKCCWKLLENQSNSKNKPLLEIIFHLLGTAVEKHGQSLEFCLKIIQLLQHNENLVSVLAQLVETVVNSHNQRLVISEIVEEIDRIDIQDLSKDSSGPRAISSFISDVAEKCPKEMISSIGTLLHFLVQDSYMMRNSTLSVIGSIVSKILSEEKMNQKDRHLRDELLDKLEEHIADITTFTRCRAIQVWTRLCSERKIPVKRLDTLVEAIVSRLQDRSTYVRKNAVVFLSCFLKTNPFAGQLNFCLFQQAYERERAKLGSMLNGEDELLEMSNAETAKHSRNNMWLEIEKEVWNTLNSNIAPENMECEGEEADDLIEKVVNSLEQKKFSEAVGFYKYFKTNFAGHELLELDAECDFEPPSKRKRSSGEDFERTFTTEDDENAEDVGGQVREARSEDSDKENSDADDIRYQLNKKDLIMIKKLFLDLAPLEEIEETLTKDELQEVILMRSKSKVSVDSSIERQRVLVRYLRDIVKVIEQIKVSVPLVCQLLHSSNILDVKEAVEFFVTAYEFGLKEEAAIGIRKMLVLIFAPEPAKKVAVIEGYKRVFIEAPKESGVSTYEQAKAVVDNLTVLTKDASIEELVSLHELMRELINSSDIDRNMIRVLWERFALKFPYTTPEESRIAVQLISMIATSNPDLIRNNIDTLVNVGLDGRGTDFRLVRYTCTALAKGMSNQGRIVTTEMPFRLPKDHLMFRKLSEIIVTGIKKINDDEWIPMSEEAVRVIFSLAENPDLVCEQILRNIVHDLITIGESEITRAQTETGHNIEKDDLLSTITKVNSEVLARFLFIIGTIGLNLLIHLEINIFTELKIRNAIRDEQKNKLAAKENTRVSMRRKSSIMPKDDEDEGMDLTAVVTTEDAEAEFISNICNHELIEKQPGASNLLAILAEIVVKVATDTVNYNDTNVRAAASISLSKLMCISEDFCSKHLRLLFTILQKSKEPIIRSNTIIALGDLCLLFPNLLDPWTPMLYSSLRDPEISVRAYTLKVLSRLILSDMIKVKEQISEMAKLILESEETISSFAKLFFTGLSKKQNAIYNILPDIISNLSNPKLGVSEPEFCEVMKFMLELIDKDKHTLGLVDKLCQRFVGTTDERQWADIAYCLSLLNWTERAVLKLMDNFAYFGDKLTIAKVYEHMSVVLTNAKRLPQMKNETRQSLEEFLQKVEKSRTRGLEDGSEQVSVSTLKSTETPMNTTDTEAR